MSVADREGLNITFRRSPLICENQDLIIQDLIIQTLLTVMLTFSRPFFPTLGLRMAREASLTPPMVSIFDKVFATKTRDEWVKILIKEKLMVCPVLDLNEIRTDPQALANDHEVDFNDRLFREAKIPGYPAHFSANRARTRSSP